MPTQREQEILNLIRENPLITQKEMAERLGITRPGVASHISRLIKAGLISGKGYVLPQEKYVTVIGAVNMDIYGVLKADHPVAKGSNAGHITTQLGGVGRNIAINLAQLGVHTNFITAYGDDQNGQTFKEDALRHNINLSYAQQVSGAETSIYLYINRPGGERYIGVDDMDINHQLTPQYLQQQLASINQSSLVVFDANLPTTSIRWLYDNVKVPLYAKAVSVDKAPNLLQNNVHLSGLVINGVEGSLISGLPIQNQDDAQRAATKLWQQFSCPIYLYVDGQGIFYHDRDQELFEPYLFQPRKLNTNGVGATIIAILAYAKMHGLSQDKILKLAVKAAAMTMATNQSVSRDVNVEKLF